MSPTTTTAFAPTNADAASQETTASPTSARATGATTAAATNAPPSVSLAALVAQLSAALDDAEAQLGTDSPAITAAQKKRIGKPRKGSDKVLAQLAPIVEQYGLNSSALNTTQMLSQYNLAQTLLPLQARMQKMTKLIDDEVFTAQTSSWEMGLQFYALLQRRAKTNGNIAASLEPLIKVFSYRHPGAQKASKVTTRVKAKLRSTLEIAHRHGVTVSVAPDGGVQAIVGSPAAVAAARAELTMQRVAVAAGAETQGAAAPGAGSV